ncbi:putative GNAT family acetyltransferase [Neisseria perflava]|uniref:GNAT family N-acetyltransferase n=1 Tax=Neisseria perflava TaxID=33053 RepID=UPI0020A14081|nr:GNAT family N-acetyltransferase [Neisseria perflava]MCP1773113.1 putative GNAT family acetyltransferase [Neisseria perflava]
MPDIRHEPALQRFTLMNTEDGEIGLLQYRIADGRFDITDTRINPKYRGQGLARHLVNAAVAEAEKLGLDLASSCDYAEAILVREGRLKG